MTKQIDDLAARIRTLRYQRNRLIKDRRRLLMMRPGQDIKLRERRQRRIQALNLRREGMSFQEVGAVLGVSGARARQLFMAAGRDERSDLRVKDPKKGSTTILDEMPCPMHIPKETHEC